jgi:hypothetical protein
MWSTGSFIKTWPLSSTYVSNATLDVVINQMSYITRNFRFPGKTVVFLPALNCRCIRELNKMAAPQEKVRWSFWCDATKSVTIVQRRYRARFEKDASAKNSITECYRNLERTRRVGRAGHEAVARMWNELVKFFRAGHKSPFAEPVNSYRCQPWPVLKKRLHTKPHRLQVLQALSDSGKHTTSTFGADFLGMISGDKIMCLRWFLVTKQFFMCLTR